MPFLNDIPPLLFPAFLLYICFINFSVNEQIMQIHFIHSRLEIVAKKSQKK